MAVRVSSELGWKLLQLSGKKQKVQASERPRSGLFAKQGLTVHLTWLIWEQGKALDQAKVLHGLSVRRSVTVRRPAALLAFREESEHCGGGGAFIPPTYAPFSNQTSDVVASLGCILFINISFSHGLFRPKSYSKVLIGLQYVLSQSTEFLSLQIRSEKSFGFLCYNNKYICHCSVFSR